MGDLDQHRAALIAASQASDATATILAALSDAEPGGPVSLDPEAEAPLKLAEALSLAIQLTDPDFVDDDMRQMLGACRRFIEGWAG